LCHQKRLMNLGCCSSCLSSSAHSSLIAFHLARCSSSTLALPLPLSRASASLACRRCSAVPLLSSTSRDNSPLLSLARASSRFLSLANSFSCLANFRWWRCQSWQCRSQQKTCQSFTGRKGCSHHLQFAIYLSPYGPDALPIIRYYLTTCRHDVKLFL